MGKLDDLEEELYGKEESRELVKRARKRIVFSNNSREFPTSWLGQNDPKPKSRFWGDRNLFRLFLGILAILFSIGGAVFVFLYLGTKGQEALVTVEGREEIQAGEVVTVPIVFKNLSRVALQEVELTIILPQDSLLEDNGAERRAPPIISKKIGEIGPGEEGADEVTVKFFGKEGDEKNVEVSLLYRPENLRARFSARGGKIFKISRVPLAISWEIPPLLSRGQEVEVRVRYSSTASLLFKNMSLRLDYPPGFNFISADPLPNIGDAIWQIGALDSGQEGSITFRGRITGEEGEIKIFQAGLGLFDPLTKEWRPYRESAEETKIAVIPLAVQGFLDGLKDKTVNPGDRLKFTLRYKNNTESTLKNVSIKAYLEGDILDLSSLAVENGGVFDSESRSIIWNSAGLAEFGEVPAGKEGEVGFGILARDRPIVRGSQDKNLKVVLRSSIEVVGVPQELIKTELRSEEKLEFKVNSKITFSGRALYRSSPILNSGPLPPKVGLKTTYVILWGVRNFTNDLQNAEVRTKLPANIKWEEVVWPQDARITFDAGTSEVRWSLGLVKAGTGVITPTLTAAFQVSLTPSEADLGKSPILTNETKFLSLDNFTNQNLEARLESFSTRLTEDSGTIFGDWEVVR